MPKTDHRINRRNVSESKELDRSPGAMINTPETIMEITTINPETKYFLSLSCLAHFMVAAATKP